MPLDDSFPSDAFLSVEEYLATPRPPEDEKEFDPGRLGNGLGKGAEDRFFDACSKNEHLLPIRVRSVCRASSDEDAQGIDAIVQLANGERVPIQIKLSIPARVQHFKNPHRRSIPCIVVCPYMEDGEILDALCMILHRWPLVQI